MFLPLEAYQPAGAALGAAGGAGILGGALGLAGQVLSAPRRAVWGAFGLPDSGAEVLHKYAGMDQDSWLTKALGMGVEMAGDPLTYLGMIPGAGAGASLGAQAGEGLAEAALARGPQYAGGMEKLLEAPGIAEALAGRGGRASSLGFRLEDLGNAPGIEKALGEIPEGSSYLGHGAQGVAMRTPAGDVIRLEPPRGNWEAGETPFGGTTPTSGQPPANSFARRDIPEMLQPTRAGMAGGVRVERTPFAEALGFDQSPRGMARFYSDVKSPLEDSISARGFYPEDINSGNVLMHQGQLKVIDPGAVGTLPGGPQLPQLGRIGEDPGGLQGWLLKALGSDQAIRQRLLQQASL